MQASVLGGLVASLPGFATAAVSGDKIVFAPISDLTGIDPIWSTSTAVRNHAYLIYDTLFGVDENFVTRPQMAESWQVSEDALLTTITLRPGLKWHDGAPVTAKDCVASVLRWAARDGLGQILLSRLETLEATDERTLTFRFKEPFPAVADALGKLSSPGPFMMPERVALTSPTEQITDPTGSGPFRFLSDEWVRGSSLAYEKFEDYVPRDEPPSGTAGGKHVHVKRVEWKIIPDPSTAMTALQSGDIDWYESASTDLLPLVMDKPEFTVVPLDPAGSSIMMRLNHHVAPFNNQLLRKAVLTALDQNLVIEAVVGKAGRGRECKSFFPCGLPLSTGAGNEIIQGDLEAARAMVKESGYDDTPAVILAVGDNQVINSAALVMDEILREIGIKTELQSMDIATMISRRTSTEPVSNGGWSVFFTYGESAQFANPSTHIGLRADGLAAWPGWPDNPRLNQMRIDWLMARSPEEQKSIAAEMEKEAFDTVPYVPLGMFDQPTVYRSNVTDVLRVGLPVFWGLKKG